MADVKQILVVDDHFEMLEFLRSMLELSNREYEVLGCRRRRRHIWSCGGCLLTC